MLRTALLVVALCGVAMAQVPAFGWCPEYIPMPDFNMERVSTGRCAGGDRSQYVSCSRSRP